MGLDFSAGLVDSSTANVAEATIILTVKHLSLGPLFSFVLGAYIGAIPEEVKLAGCQELLSFQSSKS